jgi:alpha-tubulin suppressor-like RCC1 family protein
LAELLLPVAVAACGASTGLQGVSPAADASLDVLEDSPFSTDTSADTSTDAPFFTDAASTSVRGIAVGPLFACALLTNGTVECWGIVYIGNPPWPMMCDGTNSCFTTPQPMPGFSEAVSIAVGNGYTCAIISRDGSSAGVVDCLGDNTAGELGTGTPLTPGSITAVQVQSLYGVTAMTAGGRHTCGLLGDKASASAGSVQCWGDDAYGELGNGSLGPDQCHGVPCSAGPVAVQGLSNVVSVAAGTDHTCALLAGGSVACWGDNAYGELGNGDPTGPAMCGKSPCAMSPVTVPNLSGVVAIAAGAYHSCAVLSDRTVECWGRNDSGELGLGLATGPEACPNGTYCSTSPMPVSGLTGVVALALGDAHSCALLTDRTVQCWGLASAGELGDGDSTGPEGCNAPNTPIVCSTKPVPVTALGDVHRLSAGSASSCAILLNGTVDCWGDNTVGELGDGTSIGPDLCAGMACSTTPVPVF